MARRPRAAATAPSMQIVGRHAQQRELAAVTGLHGQCNADGERIHELAPPLVVVYGGVSTGKSVCVARALRQYAESFAMVDCTAVFSTRAFCRDVLGQLQSNRRRRNHASNADGDDNNSSSSSSDDEDEAGDGERTTRGDASSDPMALKGDDDIIIMGAPVMHVTTDKNASLEESASSEEEGSDGRDDRETEPKPVAFEPSDVTSLNFLGFVKALSVFMASASLVHTVSSSYSSKNGRSESATPRRTMYIALDHVEKLMDRGLSSLITCLLTVNDQLDYIHLLDEHGAPWSLCVILIARAVSLRFDIFLHTSHPAFIHFPTYTKDEVADIITHNLRTIRHSDRLANSTSSAVGFRDKTPTGDALLRKWIVFMYDLLPHTHNDWREFQHVVVQMLPSFHAFFDIVSLQDAELPQLTAAPTSSAISSVSKSLPAATTTIASESATEPLPTPTSWRHLQHTSQEHVHKLEKTRRRHLFGYDSVGARPGGRKTEQAVTSADPVAFIASSQLSANCLLLVVAAFLASFTPHESDSHFVSAGNGKRRKSRAAPATKKTSSNSHAKGLHQLQIGPKMFSLTRLLAIYSSLQSEVDAGHENAENETNKRHESSMGWDQQRTRQSQRSRADTFIHLSMLIRLRLLQRTSPPSDLDRLQFRCLADSRLVEEISRHLRFPLEAYLSTRM